MIAYKLTFKDFALKRRFNRAVRAFSNLQPEMEKVGKWVVDDAGKRLQARGSKYPSHRLIKSLRSKAYLQSVTMTSMLRQAEHEPTRIIRDSQMDEVADLLRGLQAEPILKVSRPDRQIVDVLQARFDMLEDRFQRRAWDQAEAGLAKAKGEREKFADEKFAIAMNEGFVLPAKNSAKAVANSFHDIVNAVRKGVKAFDLVPGIIDKIQKAQGSSPAAPITQLLGMSEVGAMVDKAGGG